jgi:hypothetical protein
MIGEFEGVDTLFHLSASSNASISNWSSLLLLVEGNAGVVA